MSSESIERLRFIAAEQVARSARHFCEELQEDADGVPQLQLSELNAALDAWEAYPDARQSFDDTHPVMAALASLIEDEHATDHQRRVARMALTAIQAHDDELDKEMRRWQDGIRDRLISQFDVPADRIDGVGCDSGDPLDFTLAEITQGIGYLIDDRPSLSDAIREVEKMRDECEAMRVQAIADGDPELTVAAYLKRNYFNEAVERLKSLSTQEGKVDEQNG